MRSYHIVAVLLLMTILTFGCTKKMIINIDGMPISNYEYNLKNDETKVRIVFILANYFRDYEGKEYILKPEYLDALHANRIDPETAEQLILHIKVINLKKQQFALYWEISEPNGSSRVDCLYSGKLSRKDFSMQLPLFESGNYKYSFRLIDEDGENLFDLPRMRYKVKGGAALQSDHN